jgi:hypothetical protein
MRLAAVSLFVIATAFFLLPASTHASPKMQRAATRIVPNGTSFVAIPFPSPQPSGVGNVVFLPNGTAYFTDAKNEIASFTAAGVYTRIPVAHAVESYTLLYARSVFWMAADEGIVKVAPDGTSHRWYPMTVPGNVTYIQAIVAGPDGAIYAPAVLYSKVNGAPTNVLFRISSTGSVSFRYAGRQRRGRFRPRRSSLLRLSRCGRNVRRGAFGKRRFPHLISDRGLLPNRLLRREQG